MSEAVSERGLRDRPGAIASARPRLGWLDWILLGTLGPLFLACFALHVHAVLTETLLYHAFYVSAAQTEADTPIVEGFILEYEHAGELQVGDRILRIGDVDMRGANAFEVSARTHDQSSDGTVMMEVERGGVRQPISLALVEPALPWAMIPLVVGLTLVAVIVLLRSSGSGHARLMFLAFMTVAISHCYFTGPSALQLYAGIFTFHVWGVIGFFTAGLWAIYFPPGVGPKHRIRAGWVVPAVVLWILPRTTQYLGGPLPLDSVSTQMFIADAVLFSWLLGILAWNYGHADPVGRRQVKWAVLGTYLGMLPFVLMGVLVAVNPDVAGLRTAHGWALGFSVLAPTGFLVAIARYNLLDIDRVISGTASYTMVMVLLALAGEALLEPFAGLLGERLGFDPSSSQLIFVGVLAGAAFPIQRAWRPYIDRLFFSDGRSHTEEIEHLLEELPGIAAQEADALMDHVGARLEAILGPEFCIVYERDGQGFDPTFVGGSAQAQPLSEESSQGISDVLGKRIGPMGLDSRGRRRADPEIARHVRAALNGLDAALLVPLRPHGALDAFLCLGPKCSGDVYTPTDLTLLASVAHHVSQELSHRGDR